MTRIFAEDGATIPVTVLDMSNNRVTQIQNRRNGGYSAVQLLTTGSRKANRVNKAEAGHFAKAGVEAGRGLMEFALDAAKLGELKVGDAPSPSKCSRWVNWSTSWHQQKVWGFAGSIKRLELLFQTRLSR